MATMENVVVKTRVGDEVKTKEVEVPVPEGTGVALWEDAVATIGEEEATKSLIQGIRFRVCNRARASLRPSAGRRGPSMAAIREALSHLSPEQIAEVESRLGMEPGTVSSSL